MTKRARYDGPHEEVAIFDSEASVFDPPVAVVERGKWLPDDVPARIRDELLATPYWTEINQSDQPKQADKEGDK